MARRGAQRRIERIAGKRREHEIVVVEPHSFRLQKDAPARAFDENGPPERSFFALIRNDRVGALALLTFAPEIVRLPTQFFDFVVERVDFILKRDRVFVGRRDRFGAERVVFLFENVLFRAQTRQRAFGVREPRALLVERRFCAFAHAPQLVEEPFDRFALPDDVV